LPHHPSLGDISSGLDLLLMLRSEPLYLDKEIQKEALVKLFTRLAESEGSLLQQASERRRKFPSRMFEVSRRGSRLDLNLFRGAWYENALTLLPLENQRLSERIESMCKSYLSGLSWVMRYYICGCENTDPSYFYEFNHAPLFQDLALVVKYSEIPDHPVSSEHLRPLEQLLAVLPNPSFRILPRTAWTLLGDEELFPTSLTLEYDGVDYEHRANVLLPSLPLEKIKNAIRTLPLTLEEREHFLDCKDCNLFSQVKQLFPRRSAAPKTDSQAWMNNSLLL
jgi:5'-3' exonuclease